MAKKGDEKWVSALERIIWNNSPKCPYCAEGSPYKTGRISEYKCRNRGCLRRFNVMQNTIFSAAKIPLEKIFTIIKFHNTTSVHRICNSVGISPHSGYSMLKKIRDNPSCLSWPLEYPEYFERLTIAAKPAIASYRNAQRRYHEKHPLKRGELKKRVVKEMRKDYIKRLINTDNEELIELKRLQLTIKREAKKLQE